EEEDEDEESCEQNLYQQLVDFEEAEENNQADKQKKICSNEMFQNSKNYRNRAVYSGVRHESEQSRAEHTKRHPSNGNDNSGKKTNDNRLKVVPVAVDAISSLPVDVDQPQSLQQGEEQAEESPLPRQT